MTTIESITSAILNNPADTSARMALADRLAESDDGVDQIRGQFIHGQLVLAQYADSREPVADRAYYDAQAFTSDAAHLLCPLVARDIGLMICPPDNDLTWMIDVTDDHVSYTETVTRWRRGGRMVRELPPQRKLIFRRGLLAEVHAHSGWLLNHLTTSLRTHPIMQWVVINTPGLRFTLEHVPDCLPNGAWLIHAHWRDSPRRKREDKVTWPHTWIVDRDFIIEHLKEAQHDLIDELRDRAMQGGRVAPDYMSLTLSGYLDPLPRRSGECHQCHAARLGRQHTNGPCRCCARCTHCLGTGGYMDDPRLGPTVCDRCVGLELDPVQ